MKIVNDLDLSGLDVCFETYKMLRAGATLASVEHLAYKIAALLLIFSYKLSNKSIKFREARTVFVYRESPLPIIDLCVKCLESC